MGNVDTSIIGVFDPPRVLKPGTAMAPPAATKNPGLPDTPIAAPASQAVPPQPKKTSSPNDPHASSDPPGSNDTDPPSQVAPNNQGANGAGPPPQATPANSGEPPPTPTTKGADPQQGADTEPSGSSPVSLPSNGQGPSDPKNESPAVMSALHQALQPTAASPQNQPAAIPNGSPQNSNSNRPTPAVNQPSVSQDPANKPATLPHGEPQSSNDHGNPAATANQPAVNQGAPAQPAPNQPAANQPAVHQSPNSPQGAGSNTNYPISAKLPLANDGPSNLGIPGNPPKGKTPTNPSSGSPQDPVNGQVTSQNDGNSGPVLPAPGQGSNLPANSPAHGAGSFPAPAAINQSPHRASPAFAASPPPQFAIPVESGETLSGAVINPSSVIIAGPSGGATIQAGASPTQVLGHTVSVDPAASTIIINGQEHALPPQNPTSMNDHSNANGNGNDNDRYNNQAAVTPGTNQGLPPPGGSQDQPAVLPGSPGPKPNGGGQGLPAVAPAAPITTTIDNHAIAANPSVPSALIVDGQLISHGADPVTISNTPIAYNSNGDLILGASTIPNIRPSIAPSPPPPFTTTIASHAIAAIAGSPNAVKIDGQTISRDAGPTTISGTPIAYQANGNLIIGTSTIPDILPSISSLPPSASAPTILTVNNQAATILPNNAGIAIAGTTLLPNAPAVSISGTVSASYGSASLVIGTSTVQIPTQAPSPSQESLTSITLAGQVFTYALPMSAFTASRSPTDTNGMIVGTSAIPYTTTGVNGAAIIGTTSVLYTSSIPPASSQSATQSVGGLIVGGLGPSGPANGGSGPTNGTLTGAGAPISTTPPNEGKAGRVKVAVYAALPISAGILWMWI